MSWRLTMLAAAFLAAPAAAQPVPPVAIVTPETGHIVPVLVNGQPLRLRVDPGMGLMLNPQAAQRLRLKQSLLRPSVRVGPVQFSGNSKVARLEVGGWRGNRRFYWFDRDVVAGADGTIGLADLPNPTITMQLRPAQPGEILFHFPVDVSTTLGLVYDYRLGTTSVTTRFSPLLAAGHASAAAGALIATAYDGAWAGETEQQPVIWGVVRPVRPMRFARTVSMNGFPINRLLIRTSDYRGNHLLPPDQAAAAQAEADPSEIVVTGARSGGSPLYRLTLGRDHLSACSSITYVKADRRLTLSCRWG